MGSHQTRKLALSGAGITFYYRYLSQRDASAPHPPQLLIVDERGSNQLGSYHRKVYVTISDASVEAKEQT